MTLLACQQDARLRSLDTEVVSCKTLPDGQYAVQVRQTVLYPEGGGQPCDHGSIGPARVVDVQRGPAGVVHTCDRPVPLGPATVEVDWDRRFDHMQQHSAQHLLTALAQDHFGHPTVGFHLGDRLSTVDLEGPRLDAQAIKRLEGLVNDAILAAHRVDHRTVDLDTYTQLEVRSRGLPASHTGPVRLVEIAGLDTNTCGGTHVAHTGELQAFVVVRSENLKGGQRLHWLAGRRALRALSASIAREAALSNLLTAPPSEHLAMVTKLRDGAKAAAKERSALQRELAGHLGRHLAASGDNPVGLHREGADLATLKALADAARRDRADLVVLLTGRGVFLLAGPAETVAKHGPAVAAMLEGRGGGRGGIYQGKAEAVCNLQTALDALRA